MDCANQFLCLHQNAQSRYSSLRRMVPAAFLGALSVGLVACEPYNVKSPPISAQAWPAIKPLKPKVKTFPTPVLRSQYIETLKRPLAALPLLPKVILTTPKETSGQVPVGLLLPISGKHSSLGKSMLQASLLAMFELADENFLLLPRDTKGTPKGALLAARDAIQEGAQILLGPVFGGSAQAIAPLASRAAINMVSFTNDRTVASDSTFVFGLLPEDRVKRIVSYAFLRGIRRFAALIPEGPFGNKVLSDYSKAVSQVGGVLVKSARYDRNHSSLTAAVKNLGNYNARKRALLAKRKELKEKNDERSRLALKRLDKKEVLGDAPFDAVFLLEAGDSVKTIAPLLPYYGIDTRKMRILGINDWSSRSIRREPSLAGAWYVGLSSDALSDFAERFKTVFKSSPHALASLAYDATALAAVKGSRGGGGFSSKELMVRNGFVGTAGLFRLRRGGLVEHRFSVIEVQPDGIKVVSRAPDTFVATKD
ncbi:MAG: hypothetical protein CMM75_02950 [Rhodospirillaceae bacterium]|nr:hypothetical protein [Rhodospirillaceae bacterium]